MTQIPSQTQERQPSSCPETGLSIFIRPDWVDVPLSSTSTCTLSLLEDKILVLAPSGFITQEAATVFFRHLEDRVLEESRFESPLVLLIDCSRFRGSSRRATSLFRLHTQRLGFQGYVFFGMPPLLKLSLNLTTWLRPLSEPVRVAKDYPNAARLAFALVARAAKDDHPSTVPHDREPGAPIHSATETCPVTGLNVTTRSEWTDLAMGSGFTTTFKFIGARILYSQSRGSENVQASSIDEHFRQRDKVLRAMLQPEEPFLEIRDYRHKAHMSAREPRARFLQHMMRDRHRMLGFIAFEAPPGVESIINVARNLHDIPYPAFVAKDYPTAIAAAVEILGKNLNLGTVERLSHPDWCLHVDGFSTEMELVGGSILHSKASGFMHEDHVSAVAQLRDKVRKATRSGSFDYIVADVSGVKSGSRKARRLYAASLREWHSKHPFRMYIFYGGNRFMRTAVSLARPFLPFVVRITNDLTQALDIIRRDLSVPQPTSNNDREPNSVSATSGETQDHVNELLRYIGAIDWEAKGIDTPAMPELHPFRPVFDAIALIKGELEDLLLVQKKATSALAQSEEKYRAILDGIEEGYFEVDLDGNFVLFNDAFCNLLAYDRGQLENMNYRRLLSREEARRALRTVLSVRRRGGIKDLIDWQVIRSDNSLVLIETSISLVRDASGKTVGLRGVARDMTKRRTAEKEKKRLEERLQRAQKMEAIGTLAGGVAHDLNNILSGVVSYPDLLLMDLAHDSPMRGPLTTVKQSGEKAAAIVQDLLTLARRGVAATDVFDATTAVEEYLQSPEHLSLLRHHPKARVRCVLRARGFRLRGSKTHFSKTIMNLVSNAVEAMPEGGEIFIGTKDAYVDEPIAGYDDVATGNYVILEVSDTGTGIPPSDMKQIFEPFYTKKVMGRSGTGLGMAVVWAAVKDQKGYIDVASEEGRGTTFTLYLPATEADVAIGREGISLSLCTGQGQSILVVDDVQEQRDIAQRILEKLGYRVSTVRSGEEALTHIQSEAVDLVVLDMIMEPGIDGLETYRRMLELVPQQRAIISSGFSESRRVHEAQALGAGAYVRKPYRIDEFALAIKRELEGSAPSG